MPNTASGRPYAGVRPLRSREALLQLLPEPSLSQVPEPGADTLGGSPDPQPAAGRVLPPRLHGAAGLASFLPHGPARQLRAALRGRAGCAPCRVPAPAGSDPRHDRRASHLDPDPRLSSTHPLHRHGRRSRPLGSLDRARPGFLVPVRVLSRVFRGKLLERFDRALAAGSAGLSASLGRRLLRQAAAKEWVVYSKAPMAGPAQVLRYLGRYTHRIAIGNERLVALQDGRVTFRYRDRRRGNEKGLSPSMRRTSSGVSSCTCCLAALSASDISACRPTAVASSAYSAPGSFLAHRTLPLPIPPFVNPGRPLPPTHRPRPEPLPLLRTGNAPRGHLDESAPTHERPMRLYPPSQPASDSLLERHSSVRASLRRPTPTQVSTSTTAISPSFAANLSRVGNQPRSDAKCAFPTASPRRTIPIRGGSRGLVQHVVSAGAPASRERNSRARAPTETTLFVRRTTRG